MLIPSIICFPFALDGDSCTLRPAGETVIGLIPDTHTHTLTQCCDFHRWSVSPLQRAVVQTAEQFLWIRASVGGFNMRLEAFSSRLCSLDDDAGDQIVLLT